MAPRANPKTDAPRFPPGCHWITAAAATIKSTVPATCSGLCEALSLTRVRGSLRGLGLESRIPHQVSWRFFSFLRKLCININIFLILKTLKFIKEKSVRFFHLLIFPSDLFSQASGGRAPGGRAPGGRAAEGTKVPAVPRQALLPLLSDLLSPPLPATLPAPPILLASPLQCAQNLPGWKHITGPPLRPESKAYGAEWDLGLWSGPK